MQKCCQIFILRETTALVRWCYQDWTIIAAG